jgi:hypothetical protein
MFGTPLFAVPASHTFFQIDVHPGLSPLPGHNDGIDRTDHLAGLASFAELRDHLRLDIHHLHAVLLSSSPPRNPNGPEIIRAVWFTREMRFSICFSRIR